MFYHVEEKLKLKGQNLSTFLSGGQAVYFSACQIN